MQFCTQFGNVVSLTVLPGTNYAHVQFESVEQSQALFERIKEEADSKHNNVVIV